MVSLVKGQTVSLSKAAPGLAALHIGLGWDPVKKKGFLGFGGGSDEIDLDASCILFNGAGNVIDMVWFRQLRSKDGAVRHSGDNLTGEGDGDDEVINVDLNALSADVQSLVITVNSFRGQTFNEVDNAFVRAVDPSKNNELVKFQLNDKGSFTGVIMGVVSRKSGEWQFQAIGAPQNGRTAEDLAAAARQYA